MSTALSERSDIQSLVLQDGEVSVTLLSLGCVTQDWQVPLQGRQVPVVLGYRDPQAYRDNPYFLGAVVGPVANRISGAAFMLNGDRIELDANTPPDHLHGGALGLHRQYWRAEPDSERAVRFQYASAPGEGGYPGRVRFEIDVSLKGSCLTYDMTAQSDRPTPVNLAQHSYYSLGLPDCRSLEVQIPAKAHTPFSSGMIPSGQIEPIAETAFDVRKARPLFEMTGEAKGVDLNYVLGGRSVELRGNGLKLSLSTDQACLQLYTGQHLTERNTPLPGQWHQPFAGVCLEPQGYPNAINTPQFPCPLVTPELPYRQRLSIDIRAVAP